MISSTYSLIKKLTILTSIEMNKKEKYIKSTIEDQRKEYSQLAYSIVLIFRKIYYDLRVLEGDKSKSYNTLSKIALKELIDINIRRYFKLTKDQLSNDFRIDLNSDLKNFALASGNKLSNMDMENMLHYVDDINLINNTNSISKKDLYDIWGANIYFSKEGDVSIIRFVFDNLSKPLPDQSANEEFGLDSIKKFTEIYKNYFNKKQIDFLIKEGNSLKAGFSKDGFIYNLVSMVRYYPY